MCRYVIIQRQINLAGERRDSGSWLQNLIIFVYFILDTEVDIFGESKEERFLKPLASRSLTIVMFCICFTGIFLAYTLKDVNFIAMGITARW